MAEQRNNKQKSKQRRKPKPFKSTRYVKPGNCHWEWKLRNDQKTCALTQEQLAIVRKAISTHNERGFQKIIAKRSLPIDSLKARLHEKRTKAITRIIQDCFATVRPSNWVGGHNYINVTTGPVPQATGRLEIVRSKQNRKWQGKDVHYTINIQITWLSQIDSVPRLSCIDGMLTTHAEQIEQDMWQAAWVYQPKKYELAVETGYIFRVGQQFFHGKSKEDAPPGYHAQKQQRIIDRLERGEFVSAEEMLMFPNLIAQYGL